MHLTNDRTRTSVGMLRAFITKNAVEPLKKSIGTARNDLFLYLGKTLIEQLGSSLILRSSWRNDSHSSTKKRQRRTNDEISLISELIVSFFEIAISCTSRDMPKARKDRDLFLQKIFDELKGVITFHLGPDASDSRPLAYSKAVGALLKQAVENDIRLSTTSIEFVLMQVMGLFSEDENEIVQWEIASLCLRINPDVVLNQNAISGSSSNRKANEILRKMLSKMDMSHVKKKSTDHDQIYNLRLHEVLIPLMRAFASVRDLPGFFEIWKLRLAESIYPSIWFDDDLLSTAQGLIEAGMSSAQINAILEEIESHFERLDSTQNKDINVSHLVILHCLVGGHYGEDSLSRLSQRIQSVYSTLATSVLTSSHTSGSLSWRIWRILTSINQQWLNAGVFLFANICQQLTENAFQMIEIDSNDVYGCRGKSCAFNYLASLCPFHATSDQSARDFTNLFDKSVNILLDLNNDICQQLDGDLFRVLKPRETQHNWSGKAVDIQSNDDLYLSCIARLLLQPTALYYIEKTTQRRILQQLSLLARHERYMKESPGSVVNYSWLWIRAQRCQAIFEQQSFAEDLRLRQSQNFVHSLGSVDSLRQNSTHEEYESALESLLNASVSHFSTGDTIEIANGTLEILRRRKAAPNSIAKHIQILVKIAGASRKMCKRMVLFQNIQMDNDRLQERSAVFVLAELVSQDASPEERPACDEALCNLTCIILRCVAQLFATNLTFLVC